MSAPFASCCRKTPAGKWRRPSSPPPEAAPVIRGTGGIRKLRWAGSGRGKRGGIRAIYFWRTSAEAIYMLTAYAKADREDLTAADRRALVRLVTAIERERQG